MKRLWNWWNREQQSEKGKEWEEGQISLLQELEQARLDWIHAQHRLDYVTEKDQIDYVIYAMEAAEKRYNMLLKKAKEKQVRLWDGPVSFQKADGDRK